MNWLPELILFSDCQNDWEHYLNKIYAVFHNDFVLNKPKWATGQRVALKRHPEYDGKSATFWHIISEGKNEAERTPDFRRCERIGWLSPCMEKFNVDDKPPHEPQNILWWKEKRGNEERFVLALTDFSYVVVVVDRGEYVLPWTAYPIEYEHQKRKLRQKYQNYWETLKRLKPPESSDGFVTPSTHG